MLRCISNCPITEQDKDRDKQCQLCNAALTNCLECTEDGIQCTKSTTTSVLEIDKLCYSCSSIDANYIKCSDDNTCIECNTPLKFSQNKCASRSPSTEQDKDVDGICQLCGQILTNYRMHDGNQCLSCSTSNILQQNGLCQLCSSYDPYCIRCSSYQNCTQCINPLKLTQNKCVSMSYNRARQRWVQQMLIMQCSFKLLC